MRNTIRFVTYTLVTLILLLILDRLLPGFALQTWQAGVLGIIAISLLNTFIRPLLTRVTIGLNMATFGLFSLLISVVIVWLANLFVPGFEVQGFVAGLIVSITLALAHTLVTNLLLAEEDRELDQLRVIKRFARQQPAAAATSKPGLVMLEIDGLSEPVLRLALEQGMMPTLQEWLQSGRYKLVAWEASLPCMTSAMQAGILHGRHLNIPAFRYYDKQQQRLFVSNHPRDAAVMLKPNDDGKGILSVQGMSVNNWTHGNARETLLTFTDFMGQEQSLRKQGNLLYGFFADAYLVQRAFAAMLADIWREWREARYQRVHNVLPRIDRKFPYPLVRAATTAFLPAISVYLVIEKMFEGIGTIYTTLVSYDEVAHHSGITRPDAMRILQQVDKQIRWVSDARAHVSRPYEIVLLSDHGQSQGATFKQRYGTSIAEVIAELLQPESAPPADQRDVVHADTGDEGLQFLGLLLSQIADGDSIRARVLNSAIRKRKHDGYVGLGGEDTEVGSTEAARAESVVCASGNLALVYLKASDTRMSLEEILSRYPRLVPNLLTHAGIGVILAHSEEAGAVALGKQGGVYYLERDTFDEPNPLAPYTAHTARHLRELASYANVGDLVLFSQYDPATREVAAFEELVGSHGGIGGWQTLPFLMYPAHLEEEELPPIVGAGGVYDVIWRWKRKLDIADKAQSTAHWKS